MRALPLVLIGLLVGAAAVWYLRAGPQAPAVAPDPLHRAFARARAYYLNETNADYRRARLELQPFAAELADSVAYHLDLALIDLQEINFRVQDQSRIFPEPDYQRLLKSALGHIERARALDPDSRSVAYNLARTYLKLAPEAENDVELIEAAEKLLIPLTREEPPDPSTLLLYGDLRWDKRDVEGASEAYRRIVELGEDYVPRTLFYVALSKLEQTYRRIDVARADQLRERIERDFADRPKPTSGALERGRYTEFLDLVEHPATLPDPRGMNWLQLTARTGVPAVGDPPVFRLPDLDGDCARDLVLQTPDGVRVLRNLRNAFFQDQTAEAGFPLDFDMSDAAAGDLDADGWTDLVIGGPGGLRLFLNRTDEQDPTRWKFVERTTLPDGGPILDESAREPVDCVVLWDLDHDGDLDIFAGGPRNRVYRTAVEQPPDGERFLRFVDVTGRLGMAAPPARRALMLDVEDDHDVDLLLAGPQGNAWFENLREMTFERRDLPAGEGLEAADVDNDLLEEVRIGTTVFEWREGAWQRLFDRPALLDLDGDGTIDEAPFAGLRPAGPVLQAAGSDLNRDGNRDLVLLTERGLDIYMSQPERPMAWIDVRPRGLKTNEFGLGCRVRLFAQDLRIGATCRDGLISFGLGHRTVVDSLLLRWTNGVEQGVVTPALTACVDVEEREGEVGSCPFLYTFDGERWHFIADCHSGTPLGLPYADGKYLPPRSNETIFVAGEKLRPVGGTVRLDLAEEFRELFYVDHVVLRAIDHPADARPVLNEAFRMQAPEFRVFCLDDLRPPRAARDHEGRDILELVRARDERHAVVWDELDSRYVGLAREWWIELDFGDLSAAERVLLVMDGWVEFPTASASIAASQTGTVAFRMPVLEAPGPDGRWQVIDPDAGFPAGKGKAVLVDLTGKLPEGRGLLRVRSTQRLHWDAFQISTGPDREMRLTPLPLRRAEHRFRGVGVRVEDPSGELPWRYSHDRLETFFRWDQLPGGMLTRYGDVRTLLAEIDDRYPVLASGDVIELEFDTGSLPELPEGWVRDWCFTTEGWVKDADMNQAIRENVRPLPFHGMSGYPYDESRESHPHPDFVGEWFVRPSRALVNPEALR